MTTPTLILTSYCIKTSTEFFAEFDLCPETVIVCNAYSCVASEGGAIGIWNMR